MTAADYLMAGQLSELDRLQLQSRVWEPAGRRLLGTLGAGAGLHVVDVGCGCLGWLRVLSEWVGPSGEVVGTDIDGRLLEAAEQFIAAEKLTNVRLVRDDLFASRLPEASFDLVHARFQIAPIGRGAEQLASYRRLARPGGSIVVEDPDSASWHFMNGMSTKNASASVAARCGMAFHASGPRNAAASTGTSTTAERSRRMNTMTVVRAAP